MVNACLVVAVDPCVHIARKWCRVQASRAVPDAGFLDRCQWSLDLVQLSSPRAVRAAEVILGPLLRGVAAVLRWLH